MSKKSLVISVLFPVLLGLVTWTSSAKTQSSPGRTIPDRVRVQAQALLDSPKAKFLSSSGRNALNILSKNASIKPAYEDRAKQRVAPPPPQSKTSAAPGSNVLVNNPAADADSALDLTTQSETAVAAFQNNVVVTYNDSGDWLNAPTLEGYSLSTNAGVSYTDLGPMPWPSNGLNFGDPALVADRGGDFYGAFISLNFDAQPGFESSIGVCKSTDGGHSFGQPVILPSSTDPEGSFRDKELMAVDATAGPHTGNVYVSYTLFNKCSEG